MLKTKKRVLRLGNMLLTVYDKHITLTDMPHKLVEHRYNTGSVEHGLLQHILSPSIEDAGVARNKTKDEMDMSMQAVEVIAVIVQSTHLLLTNENIRNRYMDAINKEINGQALKDESENCLEEMRIAEESKQFI